MFENCGGFFRTDEPAESIGALMFEEVRLDDSTVRVAAWRQRQIERGGAHEFTGIERLIPFEEVFPGAFDAAVAILVFLR